MGGYSWLWIQDKYFRLFLQETCFEQDVGGGSNQQSALSQLKYWETVGWVQRCKQVLEHYDYGRSRKQNFLPNPSNVHCFVILQSNPVQVRSWFTDWGIMRGSGEIEHKKGHQTAGSEDPVPGAAAIWAYPESGGSESQGLLGTALKGSLQAFSDLASSSRPTGEE